MRRYSLRSPVPLLHLHLRSSSSPYVSKHRRRSFHRCDVSSQTDITHMESVLQRATAILAEINYSPTRVKRDLPSLITGSRIEPRTIYTRYRKTRPITKVYRIKTMPSCRYHYYYYFLFTNDFIDKLLCIDRSYKFSWSILPDGGLSGSNTI